MHYDLTEKDIGDLFASQIGDVLFTRIEFDTAGRSLGVGYVGFVDPNNCDLAIEKFDGRKAAGNVISVSNGIPLNERIGISTGGGGGGNGRRERGGNGGRRERKPKPTVEDLDAELENYRLQKDVTPTQDETNNNQEFQQQQQQEQEQEQHQQPIADAEQQNNNNDNDVEPMQVEDQKPFPAVN